MKKKQTYMSDATFIEAVQQSRSLRQISDKLRELGYGGDQVAIRRRINILNLDTSHFERQFKTVPRSSGKKGTPWVYQLPEAEFRSIAAQVTSFSMFAAAVGHKMSGASSRDVVRNRAKQLGVSLDHFIYSRNGTKPERVLVKNSPINGNNHTQLIKLLVRHNIAENKCSGCGTDPIWQGQRLNFRVFRHNGDQQDLRPENLAILCPNCISQERYSKEYAERSKKSVAARRKAAELRSLKELARNAQKIR